MGLSSPKRRKAIQPMAVLLLTAVIQLADSIFHLIRTALETFSYFVLIIRKEPR